MLKNSEGHAVRLSIDLSNLALYSGPVSVWDIHKKRGITYSGCHQQAKHFLTLGLIREVERRPCQKNRKASVILYKLTTKGQKLLRMFPISEGMG